MKTRISSLLILILILVLSFTQCANNVDVDAEITEIDKIGKQLMAALEENDVDAIMRGLTQDHITMAPNEPAFEDLTKLRIWLKEHFWETHKDIINEALYPSVKEYA